MQGLPRAVWQAKLIHQHGWPSAHAAAGGAVTPMLATAIAPATKALFAFLMPVPLSSRPPDADEDRPTPPRLVRFGEPGPDRWLPAV